VNELILGGARSGKSALAERLAQESGLAVTYIATATAVDGEMRHRIEQHQQRRPRDWQLIEEPLRLAGILEKSAHQGRCLLVDCLTLWLSNLMHMDDGVHFESECEQLLDLLPSLPGRVIFVSNEVGLGIVPMGELSRRFQDEAGRLNQAMAAACDRVVFTVAGLPQVLKGEAL
jgi:adenosylcobinamide kinase/adenosylcobinamide-phosphate guanylyltransferase